MNYIKPCIHHQITRFGRHLLRRSILFLFAFVLSLGLMAQEVIRVTGKVVSKDKNLPLIGVNVVEASTNRLLTTTDADGRFATNVMSNGTLRFSMIGADAATVKVKNQNYIEVSLVEKDVFLEEATVVAKRITNKMLPEVTVIEVEGNKLKIRTNLRVPKEMFHRGIRSVSQPIIYNVVRNEQMLMRPLVYEGREYHRTQDRMYDFDMEHRDSLFPYVTVHNDSTYKGGEDNYHLVAYVDSIYTDHPNDDHRCEFLMALENYNRILYRDTTIIANGTVNPLRFLDYSLEGSSITDPQYFPKSEPQLRNSKGEVRLRFAIGKSNLDVNDEQNREELDKLRREMNAIAANPDRNLRAFSIKGTASPDGRYASNLKLAEARMKSALQHVMQQVTQRDRQSMEVKSSAKVAGWDEVATLLRRDSLIEEAEAVESIIKKYSRLDDQSARMKQLGFYKSLLLGKYLPMLRRVEYEMVYTEFRDLTEEEVRELYEKDYRQLTQFEFFRLFHNEADTARRESILVHALEVSPSFMLAANELAVIKLGRNEKDCELLARFVGSKAPAEVNLNHIVALLGNGHYSDADTLTVFLHPDDPRSHLIKAVSEALNGHYEAAYPTIAATGKRNEALLLLAMKRNEEAWKIAEELPDDEAVHLYIRAICLNRLEKPVEAYTELKKAFAKDPALKKVAEVDGDVNGLLPDKKPGTK